MQLMAKPVAVEEIQAFREIYRQEMACQIVHDSIHYRAGWTREFLLRLDEKAVGYGSVAHGGPWKENPTIYEFFVLEQERVRAFKLFELFLRESGAKTIETQSNDPHLSVMLHAFGEGVETEAILFKDGIRTTHSGNGAIFRPTRLEDQEGVIQSELDGAASWVLEFEQKVVAAGDILYHYNPPYGDIYMKVAAEYRRRGLGTFLVQELKKVCYENGSVPGARCRLDNILSRKTLQKAGFIACGVLLRGWVRSANT